MENVLKNLQKGYARLYYEAVAAHTASQVRRVSRKSYLFYGCEVEK